MNLLKRCIFTLILLASHSINADPEHDWSTKLSYECDNPKPDWIWCEDFEIDRSSDYSEGSADRRSQTGLNGSIASAFNYVQNTSAAGGIKVAFGRTPTSYFKPVDSGSINHREIYWRMFIFLPEGWVGNGADKLSRATIISRANWSQAMIAHVWSGSDPGNDSSLLTIDPASGTDTTGKNLTTTYNDFNNLRWLGKNKSSYPIFSKENHGKWHCIEARVKLNDPSQSNGVFQLFINNRLEAERSRLNWIGSYDEYGINAVFFENYWNNGSPVDQSRYFDNLVISTEPIGCGS